ncbi:sirohydrochlorin chelatase [Neobacillus drentensis]|uniref:sirohydrochlorin chelatase n=1 Tax=Neobacillus drentensis TaxID=220684 RepID=UPI0030010320
MKAILYIGHGTRSKEGAEEAKSFIHRVMDRINVEIQEICFLELTKPGIEEGFLHCVDKGATEITVVPLFLLAAGHIKEDIPQALSSLCKRFPTINVNIRDPFGVHGKILDGIAELVRKTVVDLSAHDSILIVGRGSSDKSIHTAFTAITKGISDRLGIKNVAVCFLAATEPRLKEGLETISKDTAGKVIVIPYLLFSGLLLKEVDQMVKKRQTLGQQIIHTGQLSKHRVIEDIIIERATEGE